MPGTQCYHFYFSVYNYNLSTRTHSKFNAYFFRRCHTSLINYELDAPMANNYAQATIHSEHLCTNLLYLNSNW